MRGKNSQLSDRRFEWINETTQIYNLHARCKHHRRSAKKNQRFWLQVGFLRGYKLSNERNSQDPEHQKRRLKRKKPGTLASSAEPRFIWVPAIRRPYNPRCEKHDIYKLTGKANEVLGELVAKNSKFSHILYVDGINEIPYFDLQGKLTSLGKKALWDEIDGSMKRFDRAEIDLNVRNHRNHKINTSGNWQYRNRNEDQEQRKENFDKKGNGKQPTYNRRS